MVSGVGAEVVVVVAVVAYTVVQVGGTGVKALLGVNSCNGNTCVENAVAVW